MRGRERSDGPLIAESAWRRANAALSSHGGLVCDHLPVAESELNSLCLQLISIFRATQDEVVFRALGDIVHPYLKRLAASAVRGRTYLCAEELVCETLASVFRHAHQFAPHGANAFFRWVSTILRNHTRMAVRAHTRRKRAEALGAVSDLDGSTDPAQLLIRREEFTRASHERTRIVTAISAGLALLSPEQLACVRLRIDRRMPYETIAAELQITEGAVAMRLKRAKQRVLQELGSKGIDLQLGARIWEMGMRIEIAEAGA